MTAVVIVLSSVAKVLCVVGVVEVVVVVDIVVVYVVKVFIVGADIIWRTPLEERFPSLQLKKRSQPGMSCSHFVSKLLKNRFFFSPKNLIFTTYSEIFYGI